MFKKIWIAIVIVLLLIFYGLNKEEVVLKKVKPIVPVKVENNISESKEEILAKVFPELSVEENETMPLKLCLNAQQGRFKWKH